MNVDEIDDTLDGIEMADLIMEDVLVRVASSIKKNEIIKNVSSIIDDIVTKVFAKPKFNCEQCNIQFSSQKAWKKHNVNKHNPNKKHYCNFCTNFFENKVVLWQHKRTVHKDQLKFKEENMDQSNERYLIISYIVKNKFCKCGLE